jgi:hypothetical protein
MSMAIKIKKRNCSEIQKSVCKIKIDSVSEAKWALSIYIKHITYEYDGRFLQFRYDDDDDDDNDDD